MVNILLEGYDIDAPWLFEELKKHLPNSPDYRIIDVFNEGGFESKVFG